MGDRRSPDRDAAYLEDIVDSCVHIQAYTRGKALADFASDPMLQDAVARRLSIIGEAAKCLSDAFRRTTPELDWKNIGRLRDKLSHPYWAIELEKIWEIVLTHVASLRESLEKDPPARAAATRRLNRAAGWGEGRWRLEGGNRQGR